MRTCLFWKLDLCHMSTYLVCKCICQREIWRWVCCKNLSSCIFSSDEQFSTSKRHKSIYEKTELWHIMDSGHGWERPMSYPMLNHHTEVSSSRPTEPDNLPFAYFIVSSFCTDKGKLSEIRDTVSVLPNWFYLKNLKF